MHEGVDGRIRQKGFHRFEMKGDFKVSKFTFAPFEGKATYPFRINKLMKKNFMKNPKHSKHL